MVTSVGTSGWSYDHRESELYPPGLPARDWLARYAGAFSTVELNGSFYRWAKPSAFRDWQRLPDGFRLSVKAPRGEAMAAAFARDGVAMVRSGA